MYTVPDPRPRIVDAPLLAIDPGRSGGLAYQDWLQDVVAAPLPKAQTPMVDAIRDAVTTVRPRLVLLEDVGYHRSGNSASSSASLARCVGAIDAALRCCSVPVYWVPPKTWLASPPFDRLPRRPRMPSDATPDDRKKARDKHDRLRKRLIKEFMRRQYPGTRMTLATADAVGILHWGLRSTRVAATIDTQRAMEA
jgi:hypothetical protein